VYISYQLFLPHSLMSQFNAAKNYYQTLGLPTSATAVEIKKAYIDLARIYHPDVKTGNEAKFKDIAEAFEVLRDEQLRNQYNSARIPRERQEEQFQKGQGQAKEQQEQTKEQQRQTKENGKYRRADDFGWFEGWKSPFEKFEQASWKKKMKIIEKWQRLARGPSPTDFSYWGKRSNPFDPFQSSDEDENLSEDEAIALVLAIGILLTVGYCSFKVWEAYSALRQKLREMRRKLREMTIFQQPVVRPAPKRDLEQETGPLPRARVSRSRWEDEPGASFWSP
jgi:curved DNA-binding protein CbpA